MMSFAPGRLLATTTATTVLAFVATLSYSHSRLLPLDEHAIGVTTNAAPSVEALAAVRGKLVRLLADAHAAVDGDGDGASPGDLVVAARNELHAAIARYQALPQFPDEPELAADVAMAAGPVEAALQRAVAAAATGDRQRARRILDRELHPAVWQLDEALAALVAFNSDRVHAGMAAIGASRHSALHAAWALGAASVGLAIVSAIAALLVLRSQARLTAERDRLSSERTRELESFAGRVAHDLRGPLAAMLLRLELAERRPAAEAPLALAPLRERVRQMVALVDGLFEFAVSGAPPHGTCDIDDAVAQAVRAAEAQVDAAGASLTVECATGAAVRCTPGMLASILSNLLGNAAKYIVDGTATQRQIAIRVTGEAERVRFEVSDNGPGIAEEAQARVFEPFVRVGATKQPGTGIGLATVKRLVTACGGHIGLRSSVGVGSCFWFDLPRALPPTARPDAPTVHATLVALR